MLTVDTFLVYFGVVGGVGDGSSVAKMWISHPPSVVQLGDCESPSLPILVQCTPVFAILMNEEQFLFSI